MSELLQQLQQPAALSVTVALFAGAVAYALGRLLPAVSKAMVLLAPAIIFAFAVPLLNGFMPGDSTFMHGLKLGIGGLSLDIQFSSTLLGYMIVLAAAGFTVLIAIYSFGAMTGRPDEGKYYAYMTWALAGTAIVGWAGNFFTLLIGWELVALMLFLLIKMGRAGCQEAAAKTHGMLGIGDACLLLALPLMMALSTVRVDGAALLTVGQPLYNGGLPAGATPLDLGAIAAAGYGWMGYAIYGLLVTAALAKAGAMPLHSWIPLAAKTAPTPVMAFLPGALDKLLGIYLLARVTLDVFRPDAIMQGVLMTIGAVTILAAVFMAMVQHNLKRLLSFHAVSQVGYMVLGIGTGTVAGVIGGILHMANNAIYKSNLFLMADKVGKASGSDELEDMGGLARRLPVTFACGAISAAAISGVPPFNGFVSKWLVYQGALELKNGWGALLLVVAVFGSALTLASFVKVLYSAFLSRRPVHVPPEAAGVRETLSSALPMIVLAAACVFLGVYPQPVIDLLLIPSVENLGLKGPAVATEGLMLQTGGVGLWMPALALGLIVAGLLAGLLVLWIFSSKRIRVVRPYLSGEIGAGDDRFRYSGAGFYETIHRLPWLGALLHEGERGALDVFVVLRKAGRKKEGEA